MNILYTNPGSKPHSARHLQVLQPNPVQVEDGAFRLKFFAGYPATALRMVQQATVRAPYF